MVPNYILSAKKSIKITKIFALSEKNSVIKFFFLDVLPKYISDVKERDTVKAPKIDMVFAENIFFLKILFR